MVRFCGVLTLSEGIQGATIKVNVIFVKSLCSTQCGVVGQTMNKTTFIMSRKASICDIWRTDTFFN